MDSVPSSTSKRTPLHLRKRTVQPEECPRASASALQRMTHGTSGSRATHPATAKSASDASWSSSAAAPQPATEAAPGAGQAPSARGAPRGGDSPCPPARQCPFASSHRATSDAAAAAVAASSSGRCLLYLARRARRCDRLERARSSRAPSGSSAVGVCVAMKCSLAVRLSRRAGRWCGWRSGRWSWPWSWSWGAAGGGAGGAGWCGSRGGAGGAVAWGGGRGVGVAGVGVVVVVVVGGGGGEWREKTEEEKEEPRSRTTSCMWGRTFRRRLRAWATGWLVKALASCVRETFLELGFCEGAFEGGRRDGLVGNEYGTRSGSI